MQIGEPLRHPVESLRTAPYGFGLVTMGLGDIAIQSVFDRGHGLAFLMTEVGFGALTIVLGSSYVKTQFKLRRRLESSINEHGYDERAMSTTTNQWCDRQTARVVSENLGYIEDYKSLCDDTKDNNELTWIPHI